MYQRQILPMLNMPQFGGQQIGHVSAQGGGQIIPQAPQAQPGMLGGMGGLGMMGLAGGMKGLLSPDAPIDSSAIMNAAGVPTLDSHALAGLAQEGFSMPGMGNAGVAAGSGGLVPWLKGLLG